MRLLISVVSVEEALEAVRGGADIVDVKNPEEGSLGACPPRVLREVREAVMSPVEVSAAIGDAPNLPGTMSLAALGAAISGVDYVKVGVYGPRSIDEAVVLLREVREAVRLCSSKARVVAAGYADYLRAGCLSPWDVLEAGYRAEVDVWMVDTKVKDGRPLFEFIGVEELRSMVRRAHELGMLAAIAGSLSRDHLHYVRLVEPDVVGFRSAACGGDRVRGRVSEGLVRELKLRLNSP